MNPNSVLVKQNFTLSSTQCLLVHLMTEIWSLRLSLLKIIPRVCQILQVSTSFQNVLKMFVIMYI